ncbi:MAG: hypothetical protein QOK48_1624 [Blastocatellia bacterium]|nr:hypothetical protein [Blastocatellia bacterium]
MRIKLERILALVREFLIEAIERPVPRLNRELLLQGFSFQKSFYRMRIVRAHDLRDLSVDPHHLWSRLLVFHVAIPSKRLSSSIRSRLDFGTQGGCEQNVHIPLLKENQFILK